MKAQSASIWRIYPVMIAHCTTPQRLATLALVAIAAASSLVPPAVAVPAPALVIDGYDAARTDSDWGITEPFLTDTVGYVTDPSNFGPDGLVSSAYTVGPGVGVASSATLEGVDVFFTGWVATASYTSEEKQSLRDFVLDGGSLVATTDDLAHSMVDVFGVTQAQAPGSELEADGMTSTVTNTAHPLADGPFGSVASYEHYFSTGYFSDLGLDAVEIGSLEAGTTLAVIERGTLGPGSGAVVLSSDVDLFSNDSSFTQPGGGSVVNAVLIKNIFAFIAGPENGRPEVDAGGPYTVAEGSSVQLDATAADPDGDVLTLEWAPATSFSDAGVEDPLFAGVDDGTVTVELTATDASGLSASDTADVLVTNVAPRLGAISAPAGPIAVGAGLTVTVPFTDPGALDTHLAAVDWGDGTTVPAAVSGGTVSADHAYASEGTFQIIMTIVDDDGGSDSATRQVEIHNPKIAIDVEPGSSTNPINMRSKGSTPVAVLSSSEFSAPDSVDRGSLRFGRTGNEASLRTTGAGPQCGVDDVNGDGLGDLVCQFDTQRTELRSGDTVAILHGVDRGVPVEGTDTVRVID